MKRNGKQHIFGWLAAIMLVSLSACTKNDPVEDTLQTEGAVKVKFTIQLPGTSIPTTRALEIEDEYKVNEIDVLLFDKDEKFEAVVSGYEINNAYDDEVNQKTFRVKLDEGTYDLVIIANAHSIIADAIADATLVKGTAKTDALASLIADMPADGKWITNTGNAGYKHIPMWGEVGELEVNKDTTDPEDAVVLTRMLAKVDVKVTAANFVLTSVHVYNYHKKGRVVPDGTLTQYETGKWKVTEPTVPSEFTVTPGPLSYTTITGEGKNCENEIYIFEADNKNATDPLADCTCIVVGGKYNEGPESFYRLDFMSSGSYLDILRNHRYTFTISSVRGEGYKTKDMAFESDPQVNIITPSIEVVDESGLPYIIFNGKESLGLSQTAFTFAAGTVTGEQSDNVLHIQTGASGGWSVYKTTDATSGAAADWVTFSETSGNQNVKTKVLINIPVANTGDRSAHVWIDAGDLRYPITITQNAP